MLTHYPLKNAPRSVEHFADAGSHHRPPDHGGVRGATRHYQLAETSDGFVWRLKSDSGNATDIQAFDDDRIIVNMSVWESVEQLQTFVFRTMHTAVMKDHRNWFEKPDQMTTVLWWIPAGHLPTIAEARERLDCLNANGSGPTAFAFRDVVSKLDIERHSLLLNE